MGSGLVGLHMKGTLPGELPTILRNGLGSLSSQQAPDVKVSEYKTKNKNKGMFNTRKYFR